MTHLATIVIPASPEHAATTMQRAIDSARRQSLPCQVLYGVDHDRRGAGYMRNVLTAQVDTPFVVWLDSDDWLEVTAVEQMTRVYYRGGYVFPDYYVDGKASVFDPSRLFTTGQAHGVTTFFPTAVWRALGGFDETHPAEDSDFYLRAINEGLCPIYCPMPLFTYSADGQRSAALRKDSARYQAVIKQFRTDYQGAYIKMSCCGGGALRPTGGSEQFEGAILVEALYPPMRQWGKATGRVYDAPAMQGAQMWVHADDVAKTPQFWRPIIDVQSISPDVATVLELAERSVATRVEPAPIPERAERKSTPVEKPKRQRRARKAG